MKVWHDETRQLLRREPRFRALHEAHGDPDVGRRKDSAFIALARAIVFQQLAGKAASTIWGRVLDLTPRLTPDAVLSLSDDALRGAGLSGNKMLALQDLSRRAPELKMRGFSRREDEDIIERLVTVRGIGRWSAEMFLMFHLHRPDVWPAGDLGVRRGYGILYKMDEPAEKEMPALGARFAGCRSAAAWYCWRATEN